jgi:hypothetical protein
MVGTRRAIGPAEEQASKIEAATANTSTAPEQIDTSPITKQEPARRPIISAATLPLPLERGRSGSARDMAGRATMQKYWSSSLMSSPAGSARAATR